MVGNARVTDGYTPHRRRSAASGADRTDDGHGSGEAVCLRQSLRGLGLHARRESQGADKAGTRVPGTL